MDKRLLLSIISIFFISCGENLIEEVKEKYRDGNKKYVEYYKMVGDNQELVGAKFYYKRARIRLEGNMKGGYKDGKWTEYYNNNNRQIFAKGKYKHGKQDGKWTEYFENGKIKSKVNYKDGKPDGKWTWYWRNGQIEVEKNYKKDIVDGKWARYHKNGQIEEKGIYKDGNKVGKWTSYYNNGGIKNETNYDTRIEPTLVKNKKQK
jgi:antitoxin component YwqK of YwqJK toxin-antitoxin module